MTWILLTRKRHRETIEQVQKSPLRINMVAGSIYYLLMGCLVVYLIDKYTTNTREATCLAVVIALLMYGTFDITNKTLFTAYPWSYALFDMIGGVLSTVTSVAIYCSIVNLGL